MGSVDAATHIETTPELVHLAILKDAADIGNMRVADRASEFPQLVAGGAFVPAPLKSRRGGLALGLRSGLEHLPPDQIKKLHQIGVQAVRESLMKNQREFVGLILGEARRGRNYFQRFAYQVGDQMELF